MVISEANDEFSLRAFSSLQREWRDSLRSLSWRVLVVTTILLPAWTQESLAYTSVEREPIKSSLLEYFPRAKLNWLLVQLFVAEHHVNFQRCV